MPKFTCTLIWALFAIWKLLMKLLSLDSFVFLQCLGSKSLSARNVQCCIILKELKKPLNWKRGWQVPRETNLMHFFIRLDSFSDAVRQPSHKASQVFPGVSSQFSCINSPINIKYLKFKVVGIVLQMTNLFLYVLLPTLPTYLPKTSAVSYLLSEPVTICYLFLKNMSCHYLKYFLKICHIFYICYLPTDTKHPSVEIKTDI